MNNAFDKSKAKTQGRGDVIAHVQFEQNHKEKSGDSTSMRNKVRGEKFIGHAAGVVAILMMTMICPTPRTASKRDLHVHGMPSALEMSDMHNRTSYSGIHTPMWGEQETGHEWQSTFPVSATKLGRKKCAGVPAVYSLQKPDAGITKMITYVNDILSGESHFLSEESDYPDNATKMGPGRATKLGQKTGEGVLAMYTFQKPDGGITEMITYVNDYLSGESKFLSEESNNNIADATQMSMDRTEEL